MPSFRAYKKRPTNPERKGGESMRPYLLKEKKDIEGKFLKLTYADEIKNVSGSFRH